MANSEKISDKYVVSPISTKIAADIVVKNHYLHRKPPISMAFGLVEKDGWKIYGVITYGVPCSSTLLKGICGEEEEHNIYELNRLWVSDEVPKNGESYLIGRSLKMIDKEIVVSFADTSQNHIGYIYQATNFLYCGLSAKFKDVQVEGLEDKHHATYAHGMTNQQVKEKYGDKVYFTERSRKHRYIYFNAKGKRRKELLRELKYPIKEYPKSNDGIKVVHRDFAKPSQVQMSIFDL